MRKEWIKRRNPNGLMVAAALFAAVVISLQSCETLTDDRIPAYPVDIDLTGHGIWNTWGVASYGQSRDFIIYREAGQSLIRPSGFAYSQYAATGYGGVLLIYGQDPFTLEVGPLAYDLSCPVERQRTVRVGIDPSTREAFCHVCGSRYNVCERGGSPLSGPALNNRYQLKIYSCVPATGGTGGYRIINRR